MPVPASSAQTVRTVPSPPQTTTSSAPLNAASCAIERPGSAIVVSYQLGALQPSSAARPSTSVLNAAGSSTLIGFRITASCRLRGNGSGRGASTGDLGAGSATYTAAVTQRIPS